LDVGLVDAATDRSRGGDVVVAGAVEQIRVALELELTGEGERT